MIVGFAFESEKVLHGWSFVDIDFLVAEFLSMPS